MTLEKKQISSPSQKSKVWATMVDLKVCVTVIELFLTRLTSVAAV